MNNDGLSINQLKEYKASVSTNNGASTQVGTQNNAPNSILTPQIKKDDDAYTKLIQSNEFRALSDEDKLKKLKEMMPDTQDEVLKSLINSVKSTIISKDKTTQGSASTEKAQEAVEIFTSQDPQKPVESKEISKEEQALNDYAKGLQGDSQQDVSLEDVIANIKSIPEDKRTQTQNMILDFINMKSNATLNKKNGFEFVTKYADAIDNLIPETVTNSAAWKNKTPVEKLNARVDALLSTIVPNYDKIQNDAAKEKMRKGVYDAIGSAVLPTYKELPEEKQKFGVQILAMMSETAEASGKPLRDILTDIKDPRKTMQGILEYSCKIVDKTFLKTNIDVTSNEWKSKTSEEKVNIIARSIVTSFDSKMPEDQIQKTSEQWINWIGETLYKEDWHKNKDLHKESFAHMLSALKFASDNDPEFNSSIELMEPMQRAMALDKYEEAMGIKLTDTQRVERDIMVATNKELTPKIIYEYLQNKITEGIELTTGEQEVYNRYNDIITSIDPDDPERDKKMNVRIPDPSQTIAFEIHAKYGDGPEACQKWLQEFCRTHKGYDYNNLTNQQKKDILSMIDDPDTIYQMGEIMGIEQNDIPDFIGPLGFIRALGGARTTESYARGVGRFTGSNDSRIRKFALRLNGRLAIRDPKSANIAQNEALSSKNKYCKENAVELPNEYANAGVSLETRSYLQVMALNSNDISKDVKVLYNDNTYKFAKDDKERAYLNHEVCTNVTDPDILEYNAASVNTYVSDPTYKEQCRQDIEQAASNFDSQTQERIRNAYNTGTVSNETRARVESSSNSSSSSSSSGTGKSSGSRGTSSSHGTSGSSNTPKTGSSSSNSSAQSAAAQARAQAQQDYAQAVTQALQLRKEEALKRLAQITENYQKSVKEREERKAKEAQKTQKTEEQSTNKDYSKFNPEVRKVLEESDRVFESADKTLEIAKIDSALTDAEIAVPADKREELIQAYQSGGAASLYEKLGSVSTKYQEQYLHYFAEHASTSDLCSFAEKHVGNKNIILALYQRSNNPALLQYLGESNALDLLNKGKIKLEDFLKYASPDTVARYIQSMKEIGNTDAIKAVVSQLSLKQREETSESVIAEAQNNTPLPGSDEWMRAQQKQMENASNLGVEPKASAPKRETEKLNLDGSTPTIGAGMLSLNSEEDEFDGLSMGSNRVRMGIDIKKRDKRFFRIG